ncbi:MAG: glycosyltransferase [Herminiimonas sp.]|nr:glycosyltransferase [Herminiimonas sp.]
MKPVRLPASATLALPRTGLFALALLYILPGLFGRDPWKNDDASSFGIMWTMAHGGWADWLAPHIAGLPMPQEGPLAFWIGALCIKLFGGVLGDVMASRVAAIGFFLLGALSVWYTAYLLGRRAEAQPLRLAFGGQPEPEDYGRTLADGALLIYLGFLGLLVHSHASTAGALQVGLIAYVLYAATRVFETQSKRMLVALGIALGLSVLTRGPIAPIALWCALLLLAAVRKPALVSRLVLICLPLAIAIPAAWVLACSVLQPFARAPVADWLAWNARLFGWPSWDALRYFMKNGIWFAWPAWPFAGWAVYAWRKQFNALHIALPLLLLNLMALLVLLDPVPDETILLPLLPPLAILAAFGLPTMKRGAINAVDWFSVMTLTTCAAFIWVGWIAKQTGWPTQLARNAFKLAPGFKPELNWLAFLVAAAATASWFMLVHWRISRRPSVLWRAVVLSSGGVILCWLLLMTLWLPWGNYMKSYAGVAQQIAASLPAGSGCVDADVGPAQRASFAYFGQIPFARFEVARCDFLLLQDRNRATGETPRLLRAGERWQLLWEGHRPADRDERFRLYRRLR